MIYHYIMKISPINTKSPPKTADIYNISLSPSQAIGEIIAETCSRMLDDNEMISQMLSENRSMLVKILDKITEIIENITSALHEMFGSAEQDSEEYQLYEQAGGTFKELQERFNKMLYDASNVSKKSGVQTEYQSGEVINEDGDLRFKLSNENADLLDRYTEKTYNNYGWIAVNDVLTKSEWSQYNRKLRETLTGKTPKNFYGESVMTVGEHSSDISALVYVKGTASNPIVTKVVRVNSEIHNAENISDILQGVINRERQGYRNPYEYDTNITETQIFIETRRSDFRTLQELRRESKGSVGGEDLSDNSTKRESRSSNGTNSRAEAGVDDTSAFSNGEKELRFSVSNEDNHKQRQLDIILKNNPVHDNYHTWIRTSSDILTYNEALQDVAYEGWEDSGFDPDYDGEVAKLALETGKITVYSSYPIEQGVFVTPSKMEAESYSGNGRIYEKYVNLKDVAWIDPTQGQYAKVDDTSAFSNGEKELRFSIPSENADLLDRYTEKTYNNYGWIAVNDVLTKSEWSQYNRKLRETLTGKTPKNFYGESVMTVGEHSSDISALVYVKGTASNPIVTKVVRVNSEIHNAENISDILQGVIERERQGYRNPYEIVENYAEKKIFSEIRRQDFSSLQELRNKSKGSIGQAIDSDSGIEQNGRRSAGADSADSEAGVDNTSAFSNGEKDIRYSISSDEKVAKQESKNLEKENKALKNRLHESEIEKDRLRRETQLTEFTTKDDPSVNSFAKSLRRKYGSTMTTAELHQRLNDIYYHLAKRGGVASNVISDKCLKLAEDIANTATEKRQGEFWDELRGYFKDKRITLSEQDRNDMGDWQAFRKKYQQSFGLRNEGGLPVDVVYMELHEQFPGLFDDTITHPADQLREIGEVYEKPVLTKEYIKENDP